MEATWISFANTWISLSGKAITLVLGLFPNSPFTWNFTALDSSVMRIFRWVMPVESMLSIFMTFLTAIASLYVYRIVARWFKILGE